MDAAESSFSTSPPPLPSSYSTPQTNFYLAIDRPQFKLQTLIDLLTMAGRRPFLSITVCCSTRDELDVVCSNLANLSSHILVNSLYSDLTEARILDDFWQSTVKWNRLGKEEIEEGEDRKLSVVVVTDACLSSVGAVGESSVAAWILINYKLCEFLCLDLLHW